MKIVLVLFLVSSVLGDTSLDWTVDKIVENIRKDVIAKNQSRVEISDFETEISEKFIGIPFHAVLIAKGGTLGDTSTLVRVFPADVIKEPRANKTTIMGQFGLSKFEVSYEDFTAEVFGSKSEGRMTASCTGDSLTLSITSHFISENECESTLNYANISTIGRCSVHLDPSNFNNWFRGYLFSFLLNIYSQDIAHIVNSQIRSILEPFVYENNLCDYINPKDTILWRMSQMLVNGK